MNAKHILIYAPFIGVVVLLLAASAGTVQADPC